MGMAGGNYASMPLILSSLMELYANFVSMEFMYISALVSWSISLWDGL